MGDTFRGTIAACAGGESASHEDEWVWTVDLGDPSAYGGVLEFIAKHISCETFAAQSFSGAFDEFELAARALVAP